MTENKNSKYGKVVVVGGGGCAGRTMRAQMELLARMDDLEAYRAIGTAEEFKALKEKAEPKKPGYEGDGYYNGELVFDTWICPCCGESYEVDYDSYDYCPKYGQHIDHSGITEDD